MVDKNGRNTLPVDGGWAWAIASAGVIAHATMGSASQTNSLLFLEVLDQYDASITTGSLMFMCTTLLFSFSSVMTATYLMPKLNERICVILGGCITSGLTLSASFAPNMGIFITLMALKGVGHGIIFVPAIAMIPHYFKRFRSIASVVPWCGGSVASIIAPFIIRAVRKEFGVNGAFFLLSAVELHYILAGLLLRPTSAYRYLPDQTDGSVKDNSAPHNSSVGAADGQTEDAASSEYGSKLLRIISEEQVEEAEEINDKHVNGAEAVTEALLTQLEVRDKIDDRVPGVIVATVRASKDDTWDTQSVYRERRNTFFGSILTLDSEVGAAIELILEDVTDNPSEKSLGRWQQLYRDASLELWSLRWVLLTMLPGTVNGYLAGQIPTITRFQGASLDEAAILVTIMGCVDLASRICLGLIADTHVLSPSKLLLIASVFLAVICHLFRFATSFVTLVPVIVVIGLFVGARGPLQSMICIEVVGARNMPAAFSIMSTLNTLVGPTTNPIFGKLAEVTGSFVFAMHVMGAGYMVCAGCLLLLPLFVRLDVRRGRKI